MDTMVLPWREVGIAAARMLLEKMADPKLVLPSRSIPFIYRPGVTCTGR
jgi:hypothetical protein